MKLLRLGFGALALLLMALLLRREGEEPLPLPIRNVLSAASDAGFSVRGDRVSFNGSALVRLMVGSSETKDGREHLHVLATVEGSSLDFCVLGVGESERASSVFVESGLPAVLAAGGATGTNARPFSGASPWGVPGFRGYAGAPAIRGELEVESISPFADAPAFSVDAGLHLLKSIIGCVTDPCSRTLELDGRVIEADRPVPLAARGLGLISAFAVIQGSDLRDDLEAEHRARERLRVRLPDGLILARGQPHDCPELLPDRFVENHFDPEGCSGGRLEQCVNDCEAGIGHRCYSLALETQRDDALASHLDLEFFKSACKAGLASGCTNALSGSADATSRCSARAFQRLCDGPGDPWACTMHLRAMLAGGSRDVDQLTSAAQRACRASEDDPACVEAKRLQQTRVQP